MKYNCCIHFKLEAEQRQPGAQNSWQAGAETRNCSTQVFLEVELDAGFHARSVPCSSSVVTRKNNTLRLPPSDKPVGEYTPGRHPFDSNVR